MGSLRGHQGEHMCFQIHISKWKIICTDPPECLLSDWVTADSGSDIQGRALVYVMPHTYDM